MPRPKRRGPGGEATVALLDLEAETAAAAAGGDKRAVALHHQVLSWLDMLERAGGDADIAGLFGIFAAEGRDRINEWWANAATGA